MRWSKREEFEFERNAFNVVVETFNAVEIVIKFSKYF